MERDEKKKTISFPIMHFNSHAHVERDFVWNFSFLDEDISTHTLTWSVTKLDFSRHSRVVDFNSHAHVERDVGNHVYCHECRAISTHTLTWSVTFASFATDLAFSFQLTRSRGA